LGTNERFGLYGSVFLASLGLGMYTYFVPIFAQLFGASFLDLGYIGTAYAVTYAVGPVLVGRLVDRVNRVRLYGFAIMINVGTTVALAFSKSVSEIIVVRALAGVGLAFFWPITEALTLELAHKEGRVRELGLFSVSFGTAFLIGPTLGGIEIQDLGFFDLFVISSALMICALVEAIALLSPEHRTNRARTKHIDEPPHVMLRLLPWYLMIACYGIVSSIVAAIFPGYANSIGMSAVSIGVLFTAFGIARVLVYSTAERYSHFGERRALVLAGLLIVLGSAIILLLPTFTGFLIAMMIVGACFAVIYPLSIGLVSRHFSDAQTGFAVGSYESVYGIGSMIGPVVAGTLASFAGARLSFLSVSFFAIVMVLFSAFAKTFSTD